MADEKTYRKGLNPNSLKNLKPIQKGEVRNPDGARTQSAVQRQMRKLTHDHLQFIIDAAFMGNLDLLKQITEDTKDRPAIEVGIARTLMKAINDGDFIAMQQVMHWILGKVPDRVDHTTNGESINKNIQIEFVDPK